GGGAAVASCAGPVGGGPPRGDRPPARRRAPAPAAAAAPRLAGLPEPVYHTALARALARVARGLHAAHRAHVAHRDVKPENILVDPAGPAYLIDFRVAPHLDLAPPPQLRDRAGPPP